MGLSNPTLLLLAAVFWAAGLCRGQQQAGDVFGPVTDAGPPAAADSAASQPPPEFGAAEPIAPGARSTQFGLAPGIGAPGGEARLQYRGVATVAYPAEPLGPYGAANLGCSLGFLSPTFQSNYVGVSPQYFGEAAAACGRCITLQCDDQSCAAPGRELPALVADACGSCTGSDLAIATPLFQNLTGRAPGANPSIVVSWDLTSCAPYTAGTIKMLRKEGGSAFYQAFGFSNHVIPIVEVQVNGQKLQRGSDNFWVWNPGQPIDPTAPLEVTLVGATRQTLRSRVPSLRSADLGVQFRAS